MAKKKKKTKKKMEFSKFIFLCTSILFTIVVIGSLILMWRAGTTDALAYLIPSTAAMVTANITLYTWKAKIENVIKISKESGLSISDIKGITGNTDTYCSDSDEV